MSATALPTDAELEVQLLDGSTGARSPPPSDAGGYAAGAEAAKGSVSRSKRRRGVRLLLALSCLWALLVGGFCVHLAMRSSAAAAQAVPRLRWTVLYFVQYNNHLAEYLAPDLSKLTRGGPTGNDVVYHFLISHVSQPTPRHVRVSGAFPAQFWEGGADTTESYAGLMPGQALSKFLAAATAQDPAQQYAFFFNGDGGCVYLSIQPLANSTSPLESGYIGMSALAHIFRGAQLRLSLLAFDACLMATLEAAYELRHSTEVLVFSEQYEGGTGLNGPALIGFFRDTEATTAAASATGAALSEPLRIAHALSHDYIRRVNNASDLQPGDTIADKRDSTVVRTAGLDALVAATAALQKLYPRTPLPSNDSRNAWVDPLPEDETSYVDLWQSMADQRASRPARRLAMAAGTLGTTVRATARRGRLGRLQSLPRSSESDLWSAFTSAFSAVVSLYLQNDGLRAVDPGFSQSSNGQWYESSASRYHGLSVCSDAHADSSPAAVYYSMLQMPTLFTHW